jgi:hypothetical protein
MRLAFILTITCLLTATGLAQADLYPPEVRAVLDEARKHCADEGGERVEFDQTTVRKVELTGRGRGDYIIDHTYTRCVEREYAFCGSGGCELTILVTKRSGGYARVFSQYVNGYDIEGRRGARTIRFHLHGGYCGKSGTGGCEKRRRISQQPFKFEQR